MIDGEHTTDSVSIMSNNAITLFCSYSHKDEALRDELANHLEILKWNGDITDWHDRKILPGEEWDRDIKDSLNAAQIILLLISSDFIASRYCRDIEITRAMERHEAGEACVIPIILRKCIWSSAPFGKLQALPENATPVNDTTTWPTKDDAFTNIAEGIKKAVQAIQQTLIAAHQAKLDQYEATYRQAIQQAYPLSEAAQGKVNRLQAALNLSDADIAPVVTRLSAQYGQARQKLEQYRQEVRLYLEEDGGELSAFSRSLLEGFRISFGLTPEEATAVETEELQPIRAKQEAQAQYTKVLTDALTAENPLTEGTRRRLQRFQQTLGLSDEEVRVIEAPLIEAAEAERQREKAERQKQDAAARQQQREREEAERKRQEAEAQHQREEAERQKQATEDDLSSEKGIDYTRLRDLLKAQDWRTADQETYKVMIRAVGKQSGDRFTRDELLNFPCVDLRTIDQLWVNYSQGKFGFSVQKQIYVECGATLDGQYPGDKIWYEFCDRVGWRKAGSSLSYRSYRDLKANPSFSPTGEFPLGDVRDSVMPRTFLEVRVILFSRTETCKL